MSTMNELARDTVEVVLAGGKGTRFDPLTRHVGKARAALRRRLPQHRLLVVELPELGHWPRRRPTQHKPEALLEHIDAVWRAAPSGPGDFIAPWPAEERAPRSGYCGTADAVYRNLELIEGLDSRLVLILAGDHVYKMD